MLDSSHPLSDHIFTAGRLEDTILTLSKSIISASADERLTLMTQSERTLDEMRMLNRKHFDNSPLISANIDDLQAAVQDLAAADQPRLELIMPALSNLGTEDGFRTDFI